MGSENMIKKKILKLPYVEPSAWQGYHDVELVACDRTRYLVNSCVLAAISPVCMKLLKSAEKTGDSHFCIMTELTSFELRTFQTFVATGKIFYYKDISNLLADYGVLSIFDYFGIKLGSLNFSHCHDLTSELFLTRITKEEVTSEQGSFINNPNKFHKQYVPKLHRYDPDVKASKVKKQVLLKNKNDRQNALVAGEQPAGNCKEYTIKIEVSKDQYEDPLPEWNQDGLDLPPIHEKLKIEHDIGDDDVDVPDTGEDWCPEQEPKKKRKKRKYGDDPSPTRTCRKKTKAKREKAKVVKERTSSVEMECHQCLSCGQKYNNANKLANHLSLMGQHHNGRCRLCPDFEAKTWSENVSHFNGVHDGVHQFKCGMCMEYFRSVTQMRYHFIASCKKEAPKKAMQNRICPVCGEERRTYNLERHIKFTHGSHSIPCQFTGCKVVLKHPDAVPVHMQKYHLNCTTCEQCGKSFINKTKLTRHVASVHTARHLMPYICPICKKGFSTNQHFIDHQNIHSGAKPHKCNLCSASFASRGTLGGHRRAVHEGRKRK